MKLGIVVYSNDAETVWNAFRLANYSLGQKDEVKVFLMAKGVEYERLSSNEFDILGQADEFQDSGGTIMACGTCLKLRGSQGSETCPISSMKDLHAMIMECDRVVTF